jgi:tetratricopeptide (TPR) repeat protein
MGPQQPDVYLECAKAFQHLDEHPRAIEVLLKGAAQHEDAAILRPLGLAFAEAGQKADARDTWNRLLALNPNDYDAHNNLGVLLQESGRLGEAIEHLRLATDIDPRNASGLNNLGVALAEARRLEESADCYHRALALAPDFTIAWNNLGNALRGLGKSHDAVVALKTAIRLRPDYAEAYNNLAITYAQLEDSASAMQAFDQSLFLRPDYPEAHMNRGLQHLLLGDFHRGWADYEWRWHEKLLKPRYAHLKRWDGSSLIGKRVLVYYEQGLGDTFHFIRYAAELKDRGAHVVFECQPALRQILARTPGIDEFVIRGDKLPPADLGAPLLSLPGTLQSDLDSIPSHIPYIHPDPAMVQRWRERLASVTEFRIAIVWQGNPNHRGDWKRSIPLAAFEILARIPGVTLISLQKGHGEEQLAALQGRFPVVSLASLGADEEGFLRTAAVLKNVDLVICADTSVAHLAGAMGVPVWVLLPVAPDWRWLLFREDSPWYPTLRLFRQKALHDWNGVFQQVAEALRQLLAIGSARTVDQARRQQAGRLHAEAVVHLKEKRPAEAQHLLEQAVTLDPGCAPAHHDLGVIHAQGGQVLAAISHLRRALELQPASATAHANIGTALLQNRQIDEAITHLQEAIRLGGGNANVYNDLGAALLDSDQPQRAESALLTALRVNPFHPRAHFNLARALLLQGRYADGWPEFEWRSRLANAPVPRNAKPRWTGDTLHGERVLVTAERGVADTLQFARYCGLIRRRGGRPLLRCQPALVYLFRDAGLADEVHSLDAAPPPHDYVIPLLSLPGVFRTSLDSIPADVPYLRPPADLAATWRERLAGLPRPRIAIAWDESLEGSERELASQLLGRLGQTEGISLISIGGTPAKETISPALAKRLFVPAPPPDAASAILQQAALLANVDLVITPDSVLAHLAGAMNVPAYVALPRGASWRWLLHRPDSPWYPSLTLFRQQKTGDWKRVDDMLHALDSFLQTLPNTGQPPARVSSRFVQFSRAGMSALSAGDPAAAVGAFEHALRVDPQAPSALHNLGAAWLRLRQYPRAIHCFEQVLALQPHSIPATSNLAAALAASGQFDAAYERLSIALQRDPAAFELHYRLGLLQLAQARFSDAAAAFRAALQARPESGQAHLQLAKIACATANFSAAEVHARAALRSAHFPEACDILARAALARGDVAAAAATMANAPDADSHERFSLQAAVFEQQGRLEEAADALKQALYRDPKNAACHQRLARIHSARGSLREMLLEMQVEVPGNQQGRFLLAAGAARRDASRKDISLVAPAADDHTLFLLRFLPLLKDFARTVRLYAPPHLVPLLQSAAGLQEIVAGPPPTTPGPLLHLAALPFMLKPSPQLLVPVRPYMRVAPPPSSGTIFPPATARRRIAVADTLADDPPSRRASAALHAVLSHLAADAGISLMGDADHVALRDQPPELARRMRRRAADPAQFLVAFAALASSADLVLTADPLLYHLAGAMALPTFAILPFAGFHGWHHQAETSPWYPAVRAWVLAPDEAPAAFAARIAASLLSAFPVLSPSVT